MYFNKFLHTAHAKNISVIMIMEEAQHVSLDILNLLKDLIDIENNGQKLMSIFFAGQNEGNAILKKN